jgi:hypothetical protein
MYGGAVSTSEMNVEYPKVAVMVGMNWVTAPADDLQHTIIAKAHVLPSAPRLLTAN